MAEFLQQISRKRGKALFMLKCFSMLLAICAAAAITTTLNGCKNMCDKENAAVDISRKVYDILEKPAPENWRPSGISRTVYLDMIERIVRTAAPWVNEEGAVIDPVLQYEHGQTSPRFASTCAVAIYFGRCTDLKEKLYRVMDHCCYVLTLPDAVNRSSNFWMRELVTAYNCLKNIAPPERLAKWKNLLSQVEPEKAYKYVSNDPETLATFHNWVVYSAAGESMRQAAGIGGAENVLWGNGYFDKYIKYQMHRFNEYGMYRDPDDPVTYDITTRLQFEAALFAGYNGVWKEELRARLDKAMFATLLFMMPTGEVPFGGRSSQFYFQEGIISALCELAARRYKESDPRLAGAFKRQAHLAAQSSIRGLLRQDGKLFHLKNFFDPATRHGCDSYGHYSVYTLFAGSVYSLAALYADDTISEAPAPAEIGGFGLALTRNFYKLFCSQSGNYLEFDLKTNPKHDANGLGRIQLAGQPWGLLPSLPFAEKNPGYRIAPDLQVNEFPFSVAPEWLDKSGNICRLAAWQDNAGQCSKIANGVWQVKYSSGETSAIYTVDINQKGKLLLEMTLTGDVIDPVMVIPVLEYDGMNQPELKLQNSGFSALMSGKKLTCSSNGKAAAIKGRAVNRTGVYKLVKIPFNGKSIKLELSVSPHTTPAGN